MALSDPQALTIATIAKSLKRVITDKTSAVYATADGEVRLTVAHKGVKRPHSVVKAEMQFPVTDPVSGLPRKTTVVAYTVIDREAGVATPKMVEDLTNGLAAYISSAVFKQVIGLES